VFVCEHNFEVSSCINFKKVELLIIICESNTKLVNCDKVEVVIKEENNVQERKRQDTRNCEIYSYLNRSRSVKKNLYIFINFTNEQKLI